MKLKTIQLLSITVLINLFLHCATTPIDIKKEDPKLFKELVRDYLVVSEENPGKVELLRFIENDAQAIVGRIPNFPIDSCTWFFDRKVKNKNAKEDTWNVSKSINLNCGGQYYIVEFDQKNLQASKIKYQGVYKNIFKQLNKAIILEASCSTASSSGLKEEDERNTSIECYPYPFDLERYTKNQRREVIAGYFLYTDTQDSLDRLMTSSIEEKENDKILQTLKKDFVDEESANDKKLNPSIGKNFAFKNCEYIDFREMPIENLRGKELKEKIDKFVESDLNDPANKEGLKDAIEEYRSCGKKCVSKEKEIQILFEIKNIEAKRKILLIKKIDSKSELSKYKRFNFYSVDGSLKGIDFSVKGDIEKIYLNPSIEETTKEPELKPETNSEPKLESEITPPSEDKPNPETETIPDEPKPKSKKGKKSKRVEVLEPVPEPEANIEQPENQ